MAEVLKILVGVAACELERACWYRERQRLAQRSLFHSLPVIWGGGRSYCLMALSRRLLLEKS